MYFIVKTEKRLTYLKCIDFYTFNRFFVTFQLILKELCSLIISIEHSFLSSDFNDYVKV